MDGRLGFEGTHVKEVGAPEYCTAPTHPNCLRHHEYAHVSSYPSARGTGATRFRLQACCMCVDYIFEVTFSFHYKVPFIRTSRFHLTTIS